MKHIVIASLWMLYVPGLIAEPSGRPTPSVRTEMIAGTETQQLAVAIIPADINTAYTVAFKLKTEAVSKSDGVSIKLFQRNTHTGWSSWYPTSAQGKPGEKLVQTGGSRDWQDYRVSFMPDGAADSVELCLCLEPGMSGKVWLDEVKMDSTSTWVAQRDFAGHWHNVKKWGDQLRWVETVGAVDSLEVTLQQGKHTVWLSQLGGNRPDIELAIDGQVCGCGNGDAATGWRKIGTATLAAGRHLVTLTSRDPKGFNTKAAYAGLVISTAPDPLLPDFNSCFKEPLETLPVTLYPPKPTDPRLVIVFSSVLVKTNYKEWDVVGLPTSGAARLAAVAHKNGVPVTWMVDNEAALKMKDLLTQWHEDYGDDIGCFDWNNLSPLKVALPWASTSVAAVGGNHPVAELEKAGIHGAWGWCWEQVEIDNISDRGCPWAPFYVSRYNPKMPAQYEGQVIAFDWTMRDLNKALHIHSGEACRFSTDVDEPRRAGIMYGRAIEYWKQLLEEYQRNTDWNEVVPLFIQQEAHEMEWSFAWPCNDGYDKLSANRKVVNLNTQALDEFFKYAKTKNVTFMTQPQFVEHYRQKYPKVTPTHHMLVRDIPTQDVLNYVCRGAPLTKGPYPLTFLYSGPDGQLAVEEGQQAPKMLYNYLGDPKTFAPEKSIPQVTGFTKSVSGTREKWTITVTNPNPYDLPMGIAEWGDYSTQSVVGQCKDVIECKPIGTHLLFIRCISRANSNSTITIELVKM